MQLPDGLQGISMFLSDIAELCGTQVMWKIWQNYAGGQIYVPQKYNKNHALSKILTEEELKLFIKYFGGMKEDVATQDVQNSKKSQINELVEKGMSTTEIAKEINCSQRWVRNVKNDVPFIDSRQTSLFDFIED